jgi:hypothetical protein
LLVVYTRDPPALLSYEVGQSKVRAMDHQLLDRDKFLAKIKNRLEHAQDLMKGHYDQHDRELEFSKGDWVWLCLHHCLPATLTDKAWVKLTPKLARISRVVYRLALPHKCRIYDVFHVVFLKKFTGTQPAVVARLPPIKHGRVLPQPEKVMHACLNHGVWEILVQ